MTTTACQVVHADNDSNTCQQKLGVCRASRLSPDRLVLSIMLMTVAVQMLLHPSYAAKHSNMFAVHQA